MEACGPSRAPEDEDGKDHQVQGQFAQEAILLVVQACPRPAIHKVCQEVPYHGRTPICPLCLHDRRNSNCSLRTAKLLQDSSGQHTAALSWLTEHGGRGILTLRQTSHMRACLWKVEALDPRPPGYLGCVKKDRVLVCAGNWAVFQQLPPPHFGIYDLRRSMASCKPDDAVEQCAMRVKQRLAGFTLASASHQVPVLLAIFGLERL